MLYGVILDGYHRGTVLRLMAYVPTIKVPKSRKTKFTSDCAIALADEFEEYVAAFHAVDRGVVLYSRTGRSHDFLNCDSVHPVLTGDPYGRRKLNYFVRVKDTEA